MRLFVHIAAHSDISRRFPAHAPREALHAYAHTWLRHCLHLPDGHALHLHHNAHGKPYLRDYPDWQFNLSHSKHHLALVCGHTDNALGIDIESYPRTIRAAVIEASLSPQEWQHYQHAAEPLRYWLQVWTIKEALLKAAGTGIQQDMCALDTGFDGKETHGHLLLPPHTYTYQSHVRDDCVWALAWQQPPRAMEWHYLDLPT
ncbi:4'-phosphopantetheinyl transferase superfamily protein [Vitreoscilla massiliensis]|uniref:4'-phosphopantetheinyl transferase superfamily protein n=1 Tax=Vitreoscilla massiliensis TaxID=1689272 RepID=A0ABY4E2N5_9NEIS|nr:4'-phosphopantetheinyl transferase superfamily protein [Vitreoscilla massiliensis]UOO90039.1 4'-phosphopantetheinyl transferase superfamily protein [Vitreoscilla massiliensis]